MNFHRLEVIFNASHDYLARRLDQWVILTVKIRKPKLREVQCPTWGHTVACLQTSLLSSTSSMPEWLACGSSFPFSLPHVAMAPGPSLRQEGIKALAGISMTTEIVLSSSCPQYWEVSYLKQAPNNMYGKDEYVITGLKTYERKRSESKCNHWAFEWGRTLILLNIKCLIQMNTQLDCWY